MKKTISLIVTSFLFSTINADDHGDGCLLYTSPSPRD